MKIIDIDHQVELRNNFISEYGLTSGDVMRNEDGIEFIITEIEGQDEDGNVEISTRKVYLPEELDLDNPPF